MTRWLCISSSSLPFKLSITSTWLFLCLGSEYPPILYSVPTPDRSIYCCERLLKFYLILFASTFASRLFQALTLCTPLYSVPLFTKKKMLSLQAKGCDYFFENLVQKGGGAEPLCKLVIALASITNVNFNFISSPMSFWSFGNYILRIIRIWSLLGVFCILAIWALFSYNAINSVWAFLTVLL